MNQQPHNVRLLVKNELAKNAIYCAKDFIFAGAKTRIVWLIYPAHDALFIN